MLRVVFVKLSVNNKLFEIPCLCLANKSYQVFPSAQIFVQWQAFNSEHLAFFGHG